jgi:hypothetical protein
LHKKDKKFLKKAKAVLFVYEHQFSDGKKGLGVMLFKKPKDVKEAFKKVKTVWKVPAKNLAGGGCQLDPASGEWKIEIKMGGCTPEKIQKKGKAIFNSALATTPVFSIADITEEEIEEATEELTQDFAAIKPRFQKVTEIVKGIKKKEEAVFTMDNADFVQDVIEDIKEWLKDFDEVDEEKAIKKEFRGEAKQLQKQLGQLEKVVDVLGQRVVLSTFKTQFKELSTLFKTYQNS